MTEPAAAEPAVIVFLGNPRAVETRPRRNPDGTPQVTPEGYEVRDRVPLNGPHWTVVQASRMTLNQFVTQLMAPGGIWAAHSDAPHPSWVYATDPGWSTELGATLGCPTRPTPPDLQGDTC